MVSPKRVAYIDGLAVDIVSNYRPARRQLEEWAGGHRSAVIGASAPTGRAPINAEPVVELTSVERQALGYDRASRNLELLRHGLERTASEGRWLWQRVGHVIPDPVDTDAARMAVMMWAARHIGRHPNAVGSRDVRRFVRQLEHLDSMCRIHMPPPATIIVDCCHAHQSAHLEESVAANYRRQHLCRWCGDFRATYGVNPTPNLVRLHDRGIKITSTIVRREGIKVHGT